MTVEVAEIHLWGTQVAAVAWDDARSAATFEYHPDFLRSDIQIAPLTMPLGPTRFSFTGLGDSFLGLPGLLADHLPDRFGNAVIDAWLANQGRPPGSLSPIERLCYQGERAMGALQFRPALGGPASPEGALDVAELTDLASRVLSDREALRIDAAAGALTAEQLSTIIHVGASAGGARAKAVVAWNRETGELRSGQLDLGPDFEHWLLKFDGVTNNRDRELADPQGYGRIEYAYFLMAREAGIHMSDCTLLEEDGRAHFLTKRFDRDGSDRIHLQSLCAIAHLDFNLAGAHSYEQAIDVLARLDAEPESQVEQFRRAVFNVVARNQDDHTKTSPTS